MTEDEARAWLARNFIVSRETWANLETYVTLLLDEMGRQNLIGESTRDHVWARHIVDSAQLLPLAPLPDKGRDIWVDLGAGAGLPGIVVAILSGFQVRLIEMRRKRVEFLNNVIGQIGIRNAIVAAGKVERTVSKGDPAAVISARAYAPMERLIPSALHLADFSTIWLLPKGQNYKNELDIVRTLWQGDISVKPSLTAPESAILKLTHIGRGGGKRSS